MNILILYRYTKSSSFNHWCNVDFYKELNNFEDINVKFYGINVHQLFPDLTLIPYNSSLQMKDLKQLFNFDIIILAGRNRTFIEAKELVSWLPDDFIMFDCPKVLVEPDYHKYRKFDWFKELNISLILHRHKSNVIRADEDFSDIRNLWLPFSVDTKIFKPDNRRNRENIICFVGNSKSKAYFYRQYAIEHLNNAKLLKFAGLQKEHSYLKTLQQYKIYLNGASIYSIDCAKAFEILASGGVLFTNNAYNGFNELFSNCYITYENDFIDIVDKARDLLQDTELCDTLSKQGREIILKKHAHKHRCQDLLDILNREIFDKPRPIYNEKLTNTNIDIVYTIGNLTDDAWVRFKNSYLSVIKNTNYNIKISEVGKESHYNKIKEFIPKFDYYFHQSEEFDASIAKNNAFKYLIKENLFTFLDVDIIVPPDFTHRVIGFYTRTNKAFICSYIRLKETNIIDYKSLLNNIDTLGEEKITSAGILVCDKEIYRKLNGFDEGYQGWGGRDSDFYERARLLNKFKRFYDCCLFHQYHKRNFGKNRQLNRDRYYHRINDCAKNKTLICEFKGLIDNSTGILNIIKMLLKNNIKVCLLDKTCYEAVTEKHLTTPLSLGVSNIEQSKNLIKDNVTFKPFPNRTKPFKYYNLIVDVPLPLVGYLQNLYGNNVIKELK